MATLVQSVGPYDIIDRLGRGGMADVYLARRTDAAADAPPVVLRVIEYNAVEEEALVAERAGAALQQRLGAVEPRVPNIHAFGELDGCCFFVEMEYVEGEDLAAVMAGGPLPWERAVTIAREICLALATAHRLDAEVDGRPLHGIVHGDIKPTNVRICPDGAVRLLDFGIAKALSLTRRHTRNVFASVAYAAPERLRDGLVTHQADLWGVGVLLYEMVGGKRPFRADTTQKLEHTIMAGAAFEPLLSAPKPLRRVLRRALAHHVAQRYPDADAFAEDLALVLDGQMPAARPELDHAAPAVGTATVRTHATGDGLPEPPGADPTRRTAPSASRGTATTRTAPAPDLEVAEPPRPLARTEAEAPAGREQAPPQPPTKGSSRLRRLGRQLKRGVVALVLLALLLGAGVEAAIWNQSSRLSDAVTSGALAPEAGLQRYEQLAAFSPTGIGLRPAHVALRDAFTEDAFQTAARFRTQDVYEREWERALERLELALALGAGGDAVESRLAYVEGHLARIDGDGAVAVDHFRDALDAERQWPDPHLGLALTYLYLVQDYDRAEESLYALADAGVGWGKREQAMLADVHYFRGKERLRGCEAGDPSSSNEAERCLLAARRDLLEAVDRYEDLGAWGNSQQSARDARRQLEDIATRRAEAQQERLGSRIRRFFDRWD